MIFRQIRDDWGIMGVLVLVFGAALLLAAFTICISDTEDE